MNQREIYIFIGPPGAGKGSLSALCVSQLGWIQCSTGNLCRQHIANNTPFGKQIDFSLKSGKLISDSLVMSMVDEWLAEQQEHNHSVILDGFPRTKMQAQAFDELLKKPSLSLCKLIIVALTLADGSILQRLVNRLVCVNKECQAVYAQQNPLLAPKKEGVCDKCSCFLVRRADDNEHTVKDRLQTYYHHAKELMDYYRDQKAYCIELDAEGSLEQVFKTFKSLIGLESA